MVDIGSLRWQKEMLDLVTEHRTYSVRLLESMIAESSGYTKARWMVIVISYEVFIDNVHACYRVAEYYAGDFRTIEYKEQYLLGLYWYQESIPCKSIEEARAHASFFELAGMTEDALPVRA